MALNPELVAPYGASAPLGANASSSGRSSLAPALYSGEVMFASRTSCRLTTEHTGTSTGVWFGRRPSSPWNFSGAGTVYITNFRLVFVADKPTPEFQSMELPLLYIQSFDVVQPILGANYLHGDCQTTDSSGKVTWRVAFMSGGMSTMVPLFYQSVAHARRVSSTNQSNVQREAPTKTKSLPRDELPDFVATAAVDPNDPTVIHLFWQQSENDGPRPDAAFDTLWAKKNQ